MQNNTGAVVVVTREQKLKNLRDVGTWLIDNQMFGKGTTYFTIVPPDIRRLLMANLILCSNPYSSDESLLEAVAWGQLDSDIFSDRKPEDVPKIIDIGCIIRGLHYPATKIDFGALLKKPVLRHDPTTLRVFLQNGIEADQRTLHTSDSTSLFYLCTVKRPSKAFEADQCAELLLLHGADPNAHCTEVERYAGHMGRAASTTRIFYDTPLTAAARVGLLSLVKLLVKYDADIQHVHPEGDRSTALQVAQRYNHQDIVSFLEEQTQLQAAQRHKNSQIVASVMLGESSTA